MKAAQFRQAIRQLPVGTLDDLTGGGPFAVLSPHPDDESLGAGGLIAAACARGQRVEVILLTDGGGSHPNSKSYPRRRLVDLRRAEIEEAGARLGLPSGRLTCLQFPDTRLPLHGEGFEAAVRSIAGVLRRAGANSLFVTWKHDPHCDHEAAAHMAQALRGLDPDLKLWSYPIWGWHLDPDAVVDEAPPRGMRLDVTPWLAAKIQAIEAHRSQMTGLIQDDPDGFRFTPAMLAPFIGPFEYFFEVPQ